MSSLPIVAGQSPEAAPGVAAPVARAVAEDLEAIFPAEQAVRGHAAVRLRLGRRPPGARSDARAAERRTAVLGGLIAAICIGVSAGALIARPPAAPAGAPAPAPGPLAPAAVKAPAAAPVLAATKPQAALARPVSARRSAAARPKLVRASVARCGRSAHCHGSALTAADARLRRAYGTAVRAGVAQSILADYRQEWTSLHRRAPHEPRLVADRYREMARELKRLAAQERTARAGPPRSGPWRRFRTELAALWR